MDGCIVASVLLVLAIACYAKWISDQDGLTCTCGCGVVLKGSARCPGEANPHHDIEANPHQEIVDELNAKYEVNP